MKLSTKARYALEGMLYIAAQQPGALVNTREIAKETGISLSYLEQIFFLLKKSGLLAAERGAAGGFRLALPAEQITAGMAVRAIEGGDLAPVPCIQTVSYTHLVWLTASTSLVMRESTSPLLVVS